MRTPFKPGSFMLIALLTLWLTACNNSSQNNTNNADSTKTTDTTIDISDVPSKYLGADYHPAPYQCDCKLNRGGGRAGCLKVTCCDSVEGFACLLFSKTGNGEWKFRESGEEKGEDSFKCVCVIPDKVIKEYRLTDKPIEDLEKKYCIYRVDAIMKPGDGGLNVSDKFCFNCDKAADPDCKPVIVIKDQNGRIYFCSAITTNCTICNKQYMEPI